MLISLSIKEDNYSKQFALSNSHFTSHNIEAKNRDVDCNPPPSPEAVFSELMLSFHMKHKH